MVDMPNWDGMLRHATRVTDDSRVNRGEAISVGEAGDIASTAVAESLRAAGLDPKLHSAMLASLTRNWDAYAGVGTTPAARVAAPIVDRINRTSDRATLERIRDTAARMSNDVERHRMNPENFAQTTPQLNILQNFTQAIRDAAVARLGVLERSGDGVQRGAAPQAPRAVDPPGVGAALRRP